MCESVCGSVRISFSFYYNYYYSSQQERERKGGSGRLSFWTFKNYLPNFSKKQLEISKQIIVFYTVWVWFYIFPFENWRGSTASEQWQERAILAIPGTSRHLFQYAPGYLLFYCYILSHIFFFLVRFYFLFLFSLVLSLLIIKSRRLGTAHQVRAITVAALSQHSTYTWFFFYFY